MVSGDQAKHPDFKLIGLTGVINFFRAVFFWTPMRLFTKTILDSEGN
jgi:hypothetical protein